MEMDFTGEYNPNEAKYTASPQKKKAKLDRSGSKKFIFAKLGQIANFVKKYGKKIALTGALAGLIIIAPSLSPWLMLGAGHLGLSIVRAM